MNFIKKMGLIKMKIIFTYVNLFSTEKNFWNYFKNMKYEVEVKHSSEITLVRSYVIFFILYVYKDEITNDDIIITLLKQQ